MLLTLEGWVTNLDESVDDIKETLEVVERCIVELALVEEQLKGQVTKALSSNKDALQALLNTIVVKLTKKNDTLEAMLTTLKGWVRSHNECFEWTY